MKRIIDIALRLLGAAAIAAAFFASCSESVTDPEAGPQPQSSPIPIEYRASLQTRAATLYTQASQIESFRVWAATEEGKPYIPGDRIVKGDDGYVQSDGQDRYWPQTGSKLGFSALSGLEEWEYDNVKWRADGKCVILNDYIVMKDMEPKTDDAMALQPWNKKLQGDKPKDGQDGTMHWDKDREFDLLVAPRGLVEAPEKKTGSNAVDLPFRHALCCIEFRARNIDPALDVEITGIGLKHIQNWGHLQTCLVGDSAGEIRWILPDLNEHTSPQDGEHEGTQGDRLKPTYKIEFDKDYKVELHGAVESEAETVNIPEDDIRDADPSRYALMMIPQPLPRFNPHAGDDFRPHGASLMLRANIWNVADDDGEHDGNDKKVWGGDPSNAQGEWMLLPCGDTWEPGKKYIYTVTFGGEGTYGGYEEDEKKDDKDRVFDPIGFKVEIEPWIAGGDIVQNIY